MKSIQLSNAHLCKLHVCNASYQVNPNGKIPVENEQTNVPHIYAIGDCTSVDVVFHDAHWANPELTPVAVQVGNEKQKFCPAKLRTDYLCFCFLVAVCVCFSAFYFYQIYVC